MYYCENIIHIPTLFHYFLQWANPTPFFSFPMFFLLVSKRDRAIQKAFSENDLCSNSQAPSLDLETTMEVTATPNKYETDGKTDLESSNGIPSK